MHFFLTDVSPAIGTLRLAINSMYTQTQIPTNTLFNKCRTRLTCCVVVVVRRMKSRNMRRRRRWKMRRNFWLNSA